YVPRTPSPPTFRVLFVEEGLPAGTLWSLTVRNDTVTSRGNGSSFQEPDGRYGYSARTIPGYHAVPARYGFTVDGANRTVAVFFSPVRYRVIFEATGLDSYASWSIDVDGALQPAHGAWATVALPNGTYTYAAPILGDFLPEPRSGTVVVAGSGAVVPISYGRPMYGVTFILVGAVGNGPSLIRLAARSELISNRLVGFQIPNGTYSFDLIAPSGLSASPAHGNITVLGSPVTLRITLLPRGASPIPPLGTLLVPAAVTVVLLLGSASVAFLLAGAAERFRRRRRP
ncbi:thermopsin precursor related protein, partial [mine drainage metagenome]